MSNILKATTSGGDTVGTFLVYLKRPDDGSLTDYLVSRGLIEIDDGKVIPRLQLVDSDGNRIGQFMADLERMLVRVSLFAVKASQTWMKLHLLQRLFFRITSQQQRVVQFY